MLIWSKDFQSKNRRKNESEKNFGIWKKITEEKSEIWNGSRTWNLNWKSKNIVSYKSNYDGGNAAENWFDFSRRYCKQIAKKLLNQKTNLIVK